MMSLDNRPQYSGGCQCGAVRFRVEGALADASVCHCRMCQKASGNFYLPLVSVRGAKLTWTRGSPKKFRSSNHAFRGFCGDCGTPLTYEAPDGIAGLPGEETMADIADAPFLADLVSYQHPDHDTEEWPPAEKSKPENKP